MNKEKKIVTKDRASKSEIDARKQMLKLYKDNPIPDKEILSNLGLFIKRKDFSRMLYKYELYKKIIDVHGVIMEFGCRWGLNLALMQSFRGMHEPYNSSRKIIGFDTFEGFPSVSHRDGNSEIISKGSFSTTNGYEKYLDLILNYHEQESPISHIKKYEIIKGDASTEIKKYLENYPETIIAFAYFDMDLYEPTKCCLEAIMNNVTKGTIIGFDELNHPDFPGETAALSEVIGLKNCEIKRTSLSAHQSYIKIK